MILQKLEEIERYRIWEQYTLTGKRQKSDYGRLLSYLSDIRKFQTDIGCGRVYSSTYLGIEPKNSTPDKKYLLVVELLPARGATYNNMPIGLAKLYIGGGKYNGIFRGQVVLSLKDLQTHMFKRTFVFNCDNPVDTAKPLLEVMYSEGLMPMKTSDYYFGQYKPELQHVYNSVSNRLDNEELSRLKAVLDTFTFEFTQDSCKKEFGNFVLGINRKNMYGSFILALQDIDEKLSIHWAVKDKDLPVMVTGILGIYDRWKEDTKGIK